MSQTSTIGRFGPLLGSDAGLEGNLTRVALLLVLFALLLDLHSSSSCSCHFYESSHGHSALIQDPPWKVLNYFSFNDIAFFLN